MTQTLGIYLLFGLVLIFANIPFLSNRVMGVFSITRKTPWIRILEVIAGYFIVGLIGFEIESNLGKTISQRWEFYALTTSMFLVLSFPGFSYRFLWR